MKRSGLIGMLLLGSALAFARADTLDLADLAQSAEQWAAENLDEDVWRLLEDVDREQVEGFFRDLQQRLGGEYVVDLAALNRTARAVLPLLESRAETQPYAAWLKARLAYLEVAEEFQQSRPAPPRPPDQPAPPPTNAPPKIEREVWTRKLAAEPWPRAATNYVPRLKPVFAEQKVPPELVWIAEVESSFNPRARSPAGAVGLFQLMPETARQYGLRTWPLDHRQRPVDSARAAAKYLASLHKRFKDWRLALAAYNAGEGTVQRLLQKRKARSFDAIALHLPAETQMYVPRVEATLARREGVKLSQLRFPGG
ncbi:MAG TPA: lytic transglycosylase domain-containing protein [Candidatus Paceibacterota bacterium]|nr:lytic transglycosylase domain-containing protein [Verrucomicrobiota bacterium]HRY58578.1 lytic transglycosylase domain-containing protein [Candidatus Paceibacterota bacterium]HNS69765.1 lytic transglycosylase domain-containing protein [Verrucomicrobiota bacterium]HOW79770.1 lytic transglycosylase domain-containing protein [Verrucomicrobiota bacterium]HQE89988.1 lytic transglycosylase domain-containing protein [Verrucomicrobiota bacterium]